MLAIATKGFWCPLGAARAATPGNNFYMPDLVEVAGESLSPPTVFVLLPGQEVSTISADGPTVASLVPSQEVSSVGPPEVEVDCSCD